MQQLKASGKLLPHMTCQEQRPVLDRYPFQPMTPAFWFAERSSLAQGLNTLHLYTTLASMPPDVSIEAWEECGGWGWIRGGVGRGCKSDGQLYI